MLARVFTVIILCLSLAACGFRTLNSSKPISACFESPNEKLLYLVNSLIKPICDKSSPKIQLYPIKANRHILTSSTNNVVNQSQFSRSMRVQITSHKDKEHSRDYRLVVKKPLIYSNNVLLNSNDEIKLLQREMDRALVEQLRLLLLTIGR